MIEAKSVLEYRMAHKLMPSMESNLWPCMLCDGRGKVYDPNDPPCPIEGNKMRSRIPCTKCNGTGKGTKKEWAESFRRSRNHARKIREESTRRKRMLRSIKESLTKEQWSFISGIIRQ